MDILDVVDGCGVSALLLGRNRWGIERWIVHLAGLSVVCVYQPRMALIVTILPGNG